MGLHQTKITNRVGGNGSAGFPCGGFNAGSAGAQPHGGSNRNLPTFGTPTGLNGSVPIGSVVASVNYLDMASAISAMQLLVQDWPLLTFTVVQNADKSFSVNVATDASPTYALPQATGDGVPTPALGAVATGYTASLGTAIFASPSNPGSPGGSGKGTLNSPGNNSGGVNNGAGGCPDLNQVPLYRSMANAGGGYTELGGTSSDRLSRVIEQIAQSGLPGAAINRPSPTGTLDRAGDATDRQQAQGLNGTPPYPMRYAELQYTVGANQAGAGALPYGRIEGSFEGGDFTDIMAGV
jgi:hypothetical protein